MRIKQFFGEANRLRVILTVFFEEGFEYFIRELNLQRLLSWRSRIRSLLDRNARQTDPFAPHPVRLRQALERLGPTFIKLGQILSTRPDFISEEYTGELAKLQDDAPHFPFEDVRRIIESDLKQDLGVLFREFSEEPLAAASLSQVHRATLPNGSLVAVKVQRPDVEGLMQKDLRILVFLSDLLERYFVRFRNYRPAAAVREFSAATLRELDFTLEARNVERFRKNLRNFPLIRIPRVFRSHTSGRVLTLEFMVGVKVDRLEGDSRSVRGRQELTGVFSRSLMQQVFRHGFFHADLHPGNILVQQNKIVMLDMGQTGSLERKMRRVLILFFLAIHSKDEELAFEYLLELTEKLPGADTAAFYDHYCDILTRVVDHSLAELSLARILFQVVASAARFGVVFPANVVMMSRALITAEGILLQLNPDFNFTREALPYLRDLLWNEVNVAETVRSLRRYFPELLLNLDRLPSILRELLRRGG